MLQLPSNYPRNNPQLRHVDPVSDVVATGVSDIEPPPPNCDQGRFEGYWLTSTRSQSRHRHPADGGDPFPGERSSTHAPPPPSLLQTNEFHLPYFPQTPLSPGPELDVNDDTPSGLKPLQYDYSSRSTPTRGISWTIHPNEFGSFSASTVVDGSSNPTSSQTPVITHSATYTANCPSYNYGSIDLLSAFDYVSASPNFRLASHRRHHKPAVPPVASSPVSARRRIPKKYWCEACDAGFTQRQGLQRHCKDVHGSRRLCPHCGDFEWSLGRKYTLRKHFEAVHPGVALPEILK